MHRAWFFLFTSLISTVLLGLAPQSARADFFQEECLAEPGLLSADFSNSRLRQIDLAAKEARADAEKSPFRFACQGPGLLRGRPETGLFHREVPFSDSKGRSSADFLKRVGDRVIEAMGFEEWKLAQHERCLSGKSPATDEDCVLAFKWLNEELRPLVKSARMNLALAQTVGEVQTASFQRASTVPNLALSSLGTQKIESWEKLTEAERIRAQTILSEYRVDIEREAAKEILAGSLTKTDIGRFKNDSLLVARYGHGLLYVENLSQFPILQFLRSATPTQGDVVAALRTMQKHLAADRKFAENALAASQRTFREVSGRSGVGRRKTALSSMEPDALGLLEFTSYVEEELLNSPHDCGLVTSLQYTKENRELGNSLAIGVPLIVASFALPVAGQALAGSALGAATGVGFAVQTKFDRDMAAQRFASKIEALDEADYKKLDQADRNFKIALVLGPVAGAAAPVARVGFRAAKLGLKLSKTPR